MPETENRSEGRSNVFLTASLDTEAGACTVRIRNIASRGVLVEGTRLPPVGARVRLVRGELSATGELAWDGAGQAGINFHEPIDVGSWVKRVGHVGQQRVDRAIAAIRKTGKVPSDWQSPQGLPTLLAVSVALDAVCEQLSSSPAMSIELGEALVKLDTIAQALRGFATGKA
jgi:hypothetical protein